MTPESRLVFDLPLPPSLNHSHVEWVGKNAKTGRARVFRAPSDKAQDWTTEARNIIVRAVRAQKWSPVKTGRVVVWFTWHWPDRRKRDTHNRPKVALDAMRGLVFMDDNIALSRDFTFDVDRERPRVEVVCVMKDELEVAPWE